MAARDHLRLGPDGKYIWIENPEEEVQASAAGSPSAEGGAVSAAHEDTDADASADTDGPQRRDPRILTTISSSMSGPGIGDDVAAKRANLINAQGEPQVGRRESPEPYDPRPTRIMYAKGLLAGLIVILIACAIVVFVGAQMTI